MRVTGAVVLAGLSGATAVAAAWEAVGAIERAAPARAAARLLAPLRAGPGADCARAPAPGPGGGRHRVRGRLAARRPGARGRSAAAAGPFAHRAPPSAPAGAPAGRARARAPAVARALADALAGGHGVRGALAAAPDRRPGAPEARALALGAGTGGDARGPAPARRRPGLGRDRRRDPARPRRRRRPRRLLRATAAGLEDAARLRADARGATAQARFTAWVVGGLPVGAAAVGALASPGALDAMLGDPLSAALLVAAGLCQLIAAVLIARIARLDDAPAP